MQRGREPAGRELGGRGGRRGREAVSGKGDSVNSGLCADDVPRHASNQRHDRRGLLFDPRCILHRMA
jgi:hypothetical protein